MDARRSVRTFSDRPIDRIVIENMLRAASTAPSGAHQQPWTFCVISSSSLNKEDQTSGRKKRKNKFRK